MSRKKPVVSTNIRGEEVEYVSSTAAASTLGISSGNIRKVCRGERDKAGDLLWRFVGEPFDRSKLKLLVSYEDSFVRRAHAVHPDKYKYIYIPTASSDEAVIECLKCGTTFKQQANTHLLGSGCNNCASKAVGKSQQYSREEVLNMFKAHHGDKYDYTKVQGTASRDMAEIGCPDHGWFKQLVGSHRRGRKCPSCASNGFNSLKPAIMYYVRVDNKGMSAYKIGITNRTLKDRFGADMQYITELKTWEYATGAEAHSAEQTVLKANKEYKYTGPSLLVNGNTELFTTDIGGYDV